MSSLKWPRYALFGALAMVLILSAVSGKGWSTASEPVVAPSPARAPQVSRTQPEALPSIALERLQRRDAAADTETLAHNTFAAMSWHVPPPPPPPKPIAKPAPPPPPAAPPVPFTFLGRYEDEGARIIMLVKGDRIYTVSEGDVIDQTYRVERLAGGKLELIYLPLNTKQTINAGGT